MTEIRLDPHLHGVPQTLLIPLLGRAQYSLQANSPIKDPRAVELVNSLDYNFDTLWQKIKGQAMWWMARAYQFDELTKHFLKKHPKGTIVNLGAGLETAFYRVDNGQLTWIDLDLPEVIELKQRLLPPPDRVIYLNASILDNDWMEQVKNRGEQFLFLAGGLFMYFDEVQVKAVLTKIATNFTNAELAFDTISKRGIYYANRMLDEAKMDDAVLKWALDNPKELEAWSEHIKVKTKFPYFRDIKLCFPFWTSLQMFLLDFTDKGGIVHLQFQ